MGSSVRRVALLLFGSGFAALVYQTAWQRLFQLTFGSSTSASAAVLAIFLGGLGVGGLVLGRRVERSEKPLLFYAHLELGIALWAGLTPLLRDAVHFLYLVLGGTHSLGSLGATVVRLVLAALVIGPASVLMGGTLPAAARAVVTNADAGRRRLAVLYALNTVGAVAGALAGPLLLFGSIGTRRTLWAAVALNLAVGLAARLLGQNAPPIAAAHADANPGETADTGKASRRATIWAYITAATAGFGFLTLELVWYRVLSPVLGGSSITFGLILATALFGIGIGGFVFALRAGDRPATIELLATTLAVEALAVLVPFAWGDDLAFVAAHLRHMGNLGFSYLVGGWAFVAAVVVLPASIVSGYQFPALFALLGRGRASVGRQVGEAYAFNTVGTLLGSLLAGFVFLPTLGAVGTWRSVAVLFALLAVAGAALAWHAERSFSRIALPLAVAGAALLFSTSQGPGAVFRHSAVGAGRVELAQLSTNQVETLRRQTEDATIWERDGVESSVAINVLNGIAFIVNGKSDGAVVDDRGTQAFLGLIPAALHRNPKRAFVVGLGTGMTAGLLGREPGIEAVDVVELEPSVVEVARRASSANDDVLHNPRVHLAIGDGREVLLTNRRTYDIIVSEPSNPYRAGVAALFTREFYEAGAARLAPGGLFAQWMQSYETDGRTISIVLRTLRSVFPHVSVWSPGGSDLVLIGSQTPQIVDAERLRRVVAEPHYLDWMRRAWNMEGAEGLLAHHVVPPRAIAALVDRVPAPVNTDDENALEFAFGRHLGDTSYSALRDFWSSLEPPSRRPATTGAVDWALVDDQRYRIDWRGYTGPPASPRALATSIGCGGSLTRAEKVWPAGAEPQDLVESWVVGSIEAIHGSDAALGRAQTLESAGFQAEAFLIRSRYAEAHGDLDAAVGLLARAFAALRAKALPLCDATTRALNRARALAGSIPTRAPELLRTVATAPFAVLQSELYRHSTREIIGMRSQDPKLCAEAFSERFGRPTWTFPPLEARARCLYRVRSPDAPFAQSELDLFLANEPASFQSGMPLAVEVVGKEDQ
jgi:predicted membrane-bound spermidine synthase